jgi:hypothetical protein
MTLHLRNAVISAFLIDSRRFTEMFDFLFVLGLGILFAVFLIWGFRTLPEEKWQVMASIPRRKIESGSWEGTNITYYGLFVAISTMAASAIMLVLTSAIHVPFVLTMAILLLIFAVTLPAARFVAAIVEKKPNTFTIGGASFLGIILAPFLVYLLDALKITGPEPIPILPILCSLAITYAFGEGLGRLACISFGCCYGKPLCDCSRSIRRLFADHNFVFSGKNKKIAYEHGLDGRKVIPIQAVTAALNVTVGLVGTLLFLKSLYPAAFLLVMVGSQGWRALSEFLRADYRGEGTLSAYQKMALFSIPYSLVVLSVVPSASSIAPDLKFGLSSLWDPATILFLQLLGVAVFWYTGHSKVTASEVSLYLMKDKV